MLVPFLDLNGNGKRDKREPKVAGLKLRTNGGRIEVSKKDTSVRILDMEANTSYFIELDGNSFEHIGWQLRKKSLQVIIDPNHLKTIDIPVAILSEVTGTVYLDDKNGSRGQGRVMVVIKRPDGTVAGQTLTESDGFFSYLGLTPGKYNVTIDDAQLLKLRMKATPAAVPITISNNREGDIIDNIDITLQPISSKE